MILLFDVNERDFDSNGLGAISDSISCTVNEVRNGAYELKMTYPATGKSFQEIQIDLYTRFKEPQTEDKVQKALSSFFWEKTEEYDDAERLYRIIYEIEV